MKYTENTQHLDNRIRAHKLYSRATLESILAESLAALGPGTSPILDLGCGNGNYFPLFSGTGRRYVGVDVNRELLESFTQKFTEEKLLIRASMDELPEFMDGTFGAVYSVYSIYYTSQADTLIRQLHRVLQHGGRLVVLGPGPGAHAPEIAACLTQVSAALRQKAPEAAVNKNTRLARLHSEILPAIAATFATSDVREVDTSLVFPSTEEWTDYVLATPEARERFPELSDADLRQPVLGHAQASGCLTVSKSMVFVVAGR